MSQLLIVDGHNAIHGIEELLHLHQQNQEQARESLIHALNLYQDATSTSVILVFDGNQKERTTSGGNDQEILTIYSQKGRPADFVIESLTRQQGQRHNITVATNDLAVIHSISSHGATPLSVNKLAQLLNQTQDSYRKTWNL